MFKLLRLSKYPHWYLKTWLSKIHSLRRPKRFFRSPLFLISISLILVISASSMILILTIFKDLPSPRKLESQTYPVSTQIFDRNGQLLYEVYADANRTPVTLNSLPSYVSQATISIEDQNFYHHFGFSLQGILRASKNTLINDKLQGGSTITQQLIKTALLSPERTLKRKLREAVLTIGTEIIYSKDQILEMYLNQIPYGGTAYGIEAAAKRYFNTSAQNLSLAQAALLAGLPQAPSRYSPFINPEQAKARQAQVLRRMVEDRYITQAESDQASSQVLTYAPPSTNIKAPHFVMYIKGLLEDEYGLEKVERGGLRVTTSLDLNLQNYAQSSVSAEILALEKYKVGNGAALITKPNTGEILAMVGSKDYFDTQNDGQVNLTNRLRQPGSSIKPLNYVTALQTKRLTPASIILDFPSCFKVENQPLYCPKNYDNSWHGPVSFRQALANSYNIPAVKVLALNGLESMISTASAMGISSFIDSSRYGLSLTLGGGEVTMLDMATAFGTLANQGVKSPLHPILKIADYTGHLYYEYQPNSTNTSLQTFFDESNPVSNQLQVTQDTLTRVLNREPAYLIDDILADNNARTAAFGAHSQLEIKGQPVSVKTGTTNDLKDNWTIGFTPHYLVSVWVGNNDATPMNPYLVSGVTGAAPIWHDLMAHLLEGNEADPQPQPSGVVKISVCHLTGSFPADGVPCDARNELFWQENTPQGTNIVRKNIWVDKTTNMPAFMNTDAKDAPPVDPNNLELQEHTLISDPFITDFCLDCSWPQNDQGHAQYPRLVVDMTTALTPAIGSKTDLPPTP
jgi:penicillin-binding protein 1C